MARACSSSTTVHYLTPLNWACDVCGTFIMDYDDLAERRKLVKEANGALKKEYKRRKMSPFLHVPPIDNDMNVVDQSSCSQFLPAWIDAFLYKEETKCKKISCPVYSIMLRAQSDAFLSYVYVQRIMYSCFGELGFAASINCSNFRDYLKWPSNFALCKALFG